MKKTGRLWRYLLNGGVRTEFDIETQKKVSIINQCCIAGIIVSLTYCLLFIGLGSVYLALLAFNITTCWVVVFMMVRRFSYLFAAHVLMLTIPLALLIITFLFGKVGAEYFYFPLLILCFFIFDGKSTMSYYLMFFVLLFVLAKYYETRAEPVGLSNSLIHWIYYFNITCSFLMGGVLLWVYVRENRRQQTVMEVANIQLQSTIDEMRERNEEISFRLKELNHRTKNNLQLVSGLMGLQAEKLPASEARHMLEDAQTRIASIALVHQKLYNQELLTTVTFKGFFDDLIAHLLSIFDDKAHPVHIESKVGDFEVDIDNAVAVGLIMNEVLTNSFQHGLNSAAEKMIRMEIQRTAPDLLEISYSDSGRGVSRMLSSSHQDSFGAELIRALVAQMKGEISVREDQMNQVNIKLQLAHRP